MRNLVGCGFAGEIVFINPSGRAPAGYAGFTSLSALPQPPDLSVITESPENLPEVASDLADIGGRTAAIITRARSASDYDLLVRRMLAAAGSDKLRILGTDTIGLMVPRLNLNAGCAHLSPLPGRLAFVTDSNAVLSATIDWATQRRIGFSCCASLGSRMDIDIGDMLDYLAEDFYTRAILLYIDRVSTARKFMSAARVAARMKPVVVVKADRHRPADHHRGVAPADIDAVYDAAFLRCGVLRVADLKALFDSVTTLSMLQPLENNRLAILTNGRGIGTLALDTLYDKSGRPAGLAPQTLQGLETVLPADWSRSNPIDIRPDADGRRYAAALSLLAQDRGIDAILVLHAPVAGVSGIDVAAAVCAFAEKQGRVTGGCGILTSWLGGQTAQAARSMLAEKAVPDYDTPSEAVRAFMQMVRYRRSQEMLMETPPNIPEDFQPDVTEARRLLASGVAAPQVLHGSMALDVLKAYRIPCRSGACPAGGPVAADPNAGGLVSGMFEDPVFGPVLFWGATPSVPPDRSLALPPLNLKLAHEFLSRARAFHRLEHPKQAALTAVKISQLVCDLREIAGLELDLSPDGATVRDARIHRGAFDRKIPPLAVCPYPRELESALSLTDGRTLMLRPVRPEDEPAFRDFFTRLSPNAIRSRFLHPMKHLSHKDAAHLTQIDYDREMTLVLENRDAEANGTILGSVQITADPNLEAAEFAVVLRDDMVGLGLGPLLMRRIVEYAQHLGIACLYGDVLDDNRSMLRLCEALGFKRRRDPDDPGIVKVMLALK